MIALIPLKRRYSVEALIYIALYYLLLWILFFRIAISSLQDYVVKRDVSKSELEEFALSLKFPLRLLNTPTPNGTTGSTIPVVLNKLDEIKAQNRNFRLECLVSSFIPMLSLLIFLFGFINAKDMGTSIICCVIIILIASTLFVTWRFGHTLRSAHRHA